MVPSLWESRHSLFLPQVWVLIVLGILTVPTVPAHGAPSIGRGVGPQGLVATPQGNVTFTGNPSTDFPTGALYRNYNASAWSANNNISALYAASNSTYLFLGLNEVVTGNSLMVFVGDGGASSQGTYNLAALNAWGRGISFSSPVITFAAVYFGAQNSNLSGYGAFEVTSPTSVSNSSPTNRAIPSLSDFSKAHSAAEVGIPLAYLFPGGTTPQESITVSAFVVGSTGSWVGTGVPYRQTGQYNAGGSQSTFLVSDPLGLVLQGVAPFSPQPINVAIVFNDHQPLYQVAGNDTYNLPWTEAHATAEYIEQAILLREYPTVNISYELSGSLLYQLQNISHFAQFNDSFIEGAYLPWSSLNTTQNSSMRSNLTGDFFSIPGYVYAFNEPAAVRYKQLETLWSSGGTLTATQFEDAKVLWFLYDVSTDLVEGRLGSGWTDSAIWALHNQTSFSQRDLKTVLEYSQWLTGQVIPAFRATMRGNLSGSDNTELLTSPYYHPLTPLLLTTAMTGPSGTISKGSYPTDVLAQMNLSRDQFDALLGQYPSGLYASEAAVSEAMIPEINRSGAQWTATDEWTLQQSGVSALGYGDGGATVPQMENLYTPYVVQGANGTSSTVLFRDAPLSNNWAFNYGNLPTSTAVSDVLNYLKGVDTSLPESDHAQTLVTVMLDGENWQFMSPFADDGVPFLEQLYGALEQNSSFVHTVTPSQFLANARASRFPLPVLSSVATGSWNQASGAAAPYQSNPSLTQWSGYSAQNVLWARLDQVRAQVVGFQQNQSLVQIQNLTAYDQNLTAATAEGNLTRAWYGIYNAEGSDWFFQMAPWTISSANTIPFNETFQGDLNYSLSQLHAPAVAPIQITNFVASPNPVTVGNTSYLTVAAFHQGPLSYAYTALPPGCSTTNRSTLACAPTSTGSFAVQVFVNDTEGHTANAVLPVPLTVNPAQLRAVAIYNSSSWSETGCGMPPSLQVQFGGTAVGGIPPYDFAWDFGDGSKVSTSQDPWHIFNGTYSFSVDLQVTDGVGAQASAYVNGTGPPPPCPPPVPPTIRSFLAYPDPISLGQTTQFNVTVDDQNRTISLAFTGLPTGCRTSNESPLSCTPSVPGNFSIRVLVTDSAGFSVNATTALVVHARSVTLTSVMISPLGATVQAEGTSAPFIATPTCSGGPCPGGVVFSWTLTPSSLGLLNSTFSSSVTFVAGSREGSVSLAVNGTLNGKTVRSASAEITITASAKDQGFLGLPGYIGYFPVGVLVLLGAAVFALVLRKKDRSSGSPPDPGRGEIPPGRSSKDPKVEEDSR